MNKCRLITNCTWNLICCSVPAANLSWNGWCEYGMPGLPRCQLACRAVSYHAALSAGMHRCQPACRAVSWHGAPVSCVTVSLLKSQPVDLCLLGQPLRLAVTTSRRHVLLWGCCCMLLWLLLCFCDSCKIRLQCHLLKTRSDHRSCSFDNIHFPGNIHI